LLVDQVKKALETKVAPGPYRLQRDINNIRTKSVLSCQDTFHAFDLSQTPRPSNEDTLPIGQQGSMALRRCLNFGKNTSHTFDKGSAPSTTQQKQRLPPPLEIDNTRGESLPSMRQRDHRMDDTSEMEKQSPSSLAANASLNSSSSSQRSQNESQDSEKRRSETLDTCRPVRRKEPRKIELSAVTPTWCEDDSYGEAACSGDENTPAPKNLEDIVPQTVSTDSASMTPSTLSSITDPSAMIAPGSGQTLLSVKIQLQPGLEHIDVMFSEMKKLLDYVQELDPTAKFMSRGLGPNKQPLPPLDSSKCTHWP
jgi:hypothetical protein